MSVEQQQQLTAIELTKSTNNNNNNNSNSNNNSSSSSTNTISGKHSNNNNNSSLNLQHTTKASNEIDADTCDSIHNDIFHHKTKDPSSLDKTLLCPAKQNGQHYVHDTSEINGEHLKHQEQQQQEQQHQQQRQQHEDNKKEKEQKDKLSEQQNYDDDDQQYQDDEKEDCSLNTACIIKTPLNKTLLKKCTTNGNGNINALPLSFNTYNCSCYPETDVYTNNFYETAQHFNYFTKIPLPTTTQTTSAPTTTSSFNATIKCTKCNNNNNIHYNNYNCYYSKKATRLKPSTCPRLFFLYT